MGSDGVLCLMMMGIWFIGFLGWYIDLLWGECMIGYLDVVVGVVFMLIYVVLFNLMGCSIVGKNWLFGLDVCFGVVVLLIVWLGLLGGKFYVVGMVVVVLDIGGFVLVKDVVVLVVLCL